MSCAFLSGQVVSLEAVATRKAEILRRLDAAKNERGNMEAEARSLDAKLQEMLELQVPPALGDNDLLQSFYGFWVTRSKSGSIFSLHGATDLAKAESDIRLLARDVSRFGDAETILETLEREANSSKTIRQGIDKLFTEVEALLQTTKPDPQSVQLGKWLKENQSQASLRWVITVTQLLGKDSQNEREKLTEQLRNLNKIADALFAQKQVVELEQAVKANEIALALAKASADLQSKALHENMQHILQSLADKKEQEAKLLAAKNQAELDRIDQERRALESETELKKQVAQLKQDMTTDPVLRDLLPALTSKGYWRPGKAMRDSTTKFFTDCSTYDMPSPISWSDIRGATMARGSENIGVCALWMMCIEERNDRPKWPGNPADFKGTIRDGNRNQPENLRKLMTKSPEMFEKARKVYKFLERNGDLMQREGILGQ